MGEKRKLVFIPSYNAYFTLSEVIRKVRKHIPDAFLLVVDDGSCDGTYELACELADKVIRHKKNKGYGASQKTAFRFFADSPFDRMVMIHGDGQHDPADAPKIFEKLSECGVVLGSRFLLPSSLLRNMPPLRLVANFILSRIQNLLLEVPLSEFHSGFRGFSKGFVLNVLPYLSELSDSWIFDQQILALAVLLRERICEVPVKTLYPPSSRHIDVWNAIFYTLDTIKISFCVWKFKNFSR